MPYGALLFFFRLVNDGPISCLADQASFSYPGDAGVSIEASGLGRQALLFVEQKPALTPAETTETVAGAARGAADVESAVEDEL